MGRYGNVVQIIERMARLLLTLLTVQINDPNFQLINSTGPTLISVIKKGATHIETMLFSPSMKLMRDAHDAIISFRVGHRSRTPC